MNELLANERKDSVAGFQPIEEEGVSRLKEHRQGFRPSFGCISRVGQKNELHLASNIFRSIRTCSEQREKDAWATTTGYSCPFSLMGSGFSVLRLRIRFSKAAGLVLCSCLTYTRSRANQWTEFPVCTFIRQCIEEVSNTKRFHASLSSLPPTEFAEACILANPSSDIGLVGGVHTKSF